jgi:hypothetical protein
MKGLPTCYYNKDVQRKPNFSKLQPDHSTTHDFSIYPHILR